MASRLWKNLSQKVETMVAMCKMIDMSTDNDNRALTGNSETILVVDDEVQQRDIASQLLSSLGYTVTSVSSGEEAIEYMQKNNADLLLLDMIMSPGINGLETYQGILASYPAQKAVIAGGFSETDEVENTLKLLVPDHLSKSPTPLINSGMP